jgi:hypothetical protein
LIFNMLLTTDLSFLNETDSAEDAYFSLYELLYKVFESIVSTYFSSFNSPHKYPSWFNSDVINCMWFKLVSHKNYEKYKTLIPQYFEIIF